MEPIIIFAAIVAIIAGVFDGLEKCNQCKRNHTGVKPSNNLFTFLFIDS